METYPSRQYSIAPAASPCPDSQAPLVLLGASAFRPAPSPVLGAPANVHADRCAKELVLLAQPVFEEALIREMQLGGHVGEQHKRRWRNAGLRRVQHPNVTVSWTHRRRRGRGLQHEKIQRDRAG